MNFPVFGPAFPHHTNPAAATDFLSSPVKWEEGQHQPATGPIPSELPSFISTRSLDLSGPPDYVPYPQLTQPNPLPPANAYRPLPS